MGGAKIVWRPIQLPMLGRPVRQGVSGQDSFLSETCLIGKRRAMRMGSSLCHTDWPPDVCKRRFPASGPEACRFDEYMASPLQ